MSRAAIPQIPPPKPEPETRSYLVLSRRCVWGKKGEVIQLALGDGEESLLRAGVLERVPAETVDRPLKSAERKDERHG